MFSELLTKINELDSMMVLGVIAFLLEVVMRVVPSAKGITILTIAMNIIDKIVPNRKLKLDDE